MKYRSSTVVLLALASACAKEEPRTPAANAPSVDAAPAAKPPSANPDETTVFDLIANRTKAHTYVGDTLVIDATTTAFWKYVDGGWKSPWWVAERDGGRRASLVPGVAGVVRVPLDDPPKDRTVGFTLRAAAPGQTLSVFVNGKPAGNLAVEDNYKAYTVLVPADRWVLGDNLIRFHFRASGNIDGKRTAAAFERISVGPQDAATLQPWNTRQRIDGRDRRVLALSQPGRISYYVVLPTTGDMMTLRFELGSSGQTPSNLLVKVLREEGEPKAMWSGSTLDTKRDVSIPFGAAPEGEAVRIDFISTGPAVFVDPRIVATPGPATLPAAPKRGAPADHVLVWMVDTLRGDKVHACNPKTRVQTPNLDRIANEGVRFASATVQGNYSLPSHASLLTGVYPSVHGMLDETARLKPEQEMVSTSFHKAGFRTAMFSSNGFVSEKWGFKKDWDAYRNFIREELPNSADHIWKAALPWLKQQTQAGQRTFMYLATVEPHVAYNPPQQFLKMYWSKPYSGVVKPILTAQQLGAFKLGKLKFSAIDREYLEALYDAEVTQNDAALGKVIEDLKVLGIADRTAIVVVSDHGDEFYEHGSVGHGHSVHQEIVDIPLLVRYPGVVPAGRVVHSDVEVVDVASTVLDLAGIEPRLGQGESLVGLARGSVPLMPRAAVSTHGNVLRGFRVGRFKLITSSAKTGFYDLHTDPHEQTNLVNAKVPPVIALRAVRDVFAIEHAYETRWKKARWGTAGNLKPAFSDDEDAQRRVDGPVAQP